MGSSYSRQKESAWAFHASHLRSRCSLSSPHSVRVGALTRLRASWRAECTQGRLCWSHWRRTIYREASSSISDQVGTVSAQSQRVLNAAALWLRALHTWAQQWSEPSPNEVASSHSWAPTWGSLCWRRQSVEGSISLKWVWSQKEREALTHLSKVLVKITLRSELGCELMLSDF